METKKNTYDALEDETIKFKSGITMIDSQLSDYNQSDSDLDSENEDSVAIHLDFLENIEKDLEENPLNCQQKKEARKLAGRHKLRQFKQKSDKGRTLIVKNKIKKVDYTKKVTMLKNGHTRKSGKGTTHNTKLDHPCQI